MRKYGKWVLTLSLLAATPGLNFAAEAAKAPKGVKSARVDNQRMAESIASALKGKVSGRDITIEYKDGVAVLSGTVNDPQMKTLASSLVEKVNNVNRVDNRLRVDDKKKVATDRSRNKPASDEVMQAAHSGAKAAKGTIQQVNDSVFEAATPETTANLPGVGAPQFSAPQAAPGASNQEMAQNIAAVLTDARLDGYDIQIRFVNGVALLEGSVGTQAEWSTASRAAQSVPGVRSVQNRLVCSQEPPAGYQGGRGPYGNAPQYGNGQQQYAGGPQYANAQQYAAAQQQYGNVRGAGYMQPAPGQPGPDQGYNGVPQGGVPMAPGAPPYPPAYGMGGPGNSQAVYNSPSMPDHAWPTYAQYPNSAAVTYPQQYSASAWPYIGPFYPYPQVPLGWRDATLRWDDGQWNLMFKPRTDRWWWFFNPNNW